MSHADDLIKRFMETIDNDTELDRIANDMVSELRRLAEIERKYNEIMAQEPVAWVTMQLPDPQKGVITDAKFARYYNQSHMKLTPLYELKKDYP